MLHLSETECTTKAQLVELGKILDACCATKAPQQVKQRSKNVIAFTLVDEGDHLLPVERHIGEHIVD